MHTYIHKIYKYNIYPLYLYIIYEQYRRPNLYVLRTHYVRRGSISADIVVGT